MRFLLITAIVTQALHAQSTGLSLQIETANGQTQFRMGEMIRLKVTFENTSGIEWRTNVTSVDRCVLGFGSDRFIPAPMDGVSDPESFRLNGGITYAGFGGVSLSGKTTVVSVDLNQWLRFERVGRYTVRASLHAIGPGQRDVVLDSNPINLEITTADGAWLSEQIREDVAALGLARDNLSSEAFEARQNAVRRLRYLDTVESVREAARLLGTADQQTAEVLKLALLRSRHTGEARAELKRLMADPDEPVPAIFLETLGALETSPGATRATETAQLAALLEKKDGLGKAVSMVTLLENMPPEAVPAHFRTEMAGLFAQLPARQQEELLRWQWQKVSGPDMIPVLRAIYEAAPESRSIQPDSLAATAMGHLYELDPARTRVLLLEDMTRPAPRLPYAVLSLLTDATLPQLDQPLAANLEHQENLRTEELIARYATGAILERVRGYYAKRDREMRARTSSNIPNLAAPACEPPLVAYFLRTDPVAGEHLFRDVLAERSFPMGRCWMNVIGRAAVYYAGPAWEKVAVEALQDPAVIVKADAVGALARYGSAASGPAVWRAFREWHDWWKDRPAQMNEENRRFEMVFGEAIRQARNWTRSGDEAGRMRELCITNDCRARADELR